MAEEATNTTRRGGQSVIITPIPDLKERIRSAVREHRLNMAYFRDHLTISEEHPCGTACCLAGWAVNVHPQGQRILRSSVDTQEAALAIFEACGIAPPDFYSDNEEAFQWLGL